MNEVDAVKSESQRNQIETHLKGEDGSVTVYFDIWKFGVNVALRISDLLDLTIADINDALAMDIPALKVLESKTGKTRKIELNAPAIEIAKRRVQDNPDHTYLFQSTKDTGKRAVAKPINRKTVSRVFATAGDHCKPSVKLGTHSMRKTRGFALHSQGYPIEQICKMLNHASPAVTMRYIGVDQAAVDATFHAVEL